MLRLRAETPEDLSILSALVQDALVQRRDVYFDAKARRLVLLMQRFRWEADGTATRVRCGLRFEFVTGISQKSLLDRPPSAVFDLLSLRAVGDGDTLLVLDFAGGAGVRLEVEAMDVVLEDITDAWAARVTPGHRD
jgi:Protein of unknown function (DUF2948)